MPRLGEHGISSITHHSLGALGDILDQPIEAFAGHGGNRESPERELGVKEISFGKQYLN